MIRLINTKRNIGNRFLKKSQFIIKHFHLDRTKNKMKHLNGCLIYNPDIKWCIIKLAIINWALGKVNTLNLLSVQTDKSWNMQYNNIMYTWVGQSF